MTRRVLLLVAAGLVLFPALFVVGAHRRASAVLRERRTWMDAAAARLAAVAEDRPSPYGALSAGNAWDFYAGPIRTLASLPEEEQDEIPEYPYGERRGDLARLDAIYARLARPIELLRQGLEAKWHRRPDSAPRPDSIRVAGMILEGAIAHSRRRGRDAEALDRVILLIGLAQDASRGTEKERILTSVETAAIRQARSLFESHALTAGQLETGARHLDVLETSRPTLVDEWTVREIEETAVALGIARGSSGPRGPQAPTRGWRNLYSETVARASALGEIEGYFAEARRISLLPPAERKRAASNLGPSWLDRERPEFASCTTGRRSIEEDIFEEDARARLQRRLLRGAAAMAWFEAERGRPAGSFDELVPRYLPRALRCPVHGDVVALAPESVQCPGDPGLGWTVKRRP